LQNNTAGVREREDANRTREAGNLDEVQAAVSFAGLSAIISQPSTFSVERPAVGCSAWLAKNEVSTYSIEALYAHDESDQQLD
jgi:hypothetical protein